jgi:eukaryotic-like serine/threonine-protein kinase
VRPSRPPPVPDAPSPGATVGPYTLIDRIAVGGMAEVFRAREPRSAGDARVIVLKRMLPHLLAMPGARGMFDEEARLGACVRHPNVVEALDRGEHEGLPYLALEYVPGVDLWRLNRWLARQGHTLGLPLSTFIVTELLLGLHAVHEARDADAAPLAIVHRDVSPSNVLLSVHGDVKVGDFGIALGHLQDKASSRDSLPQRAKGKLGYLSPEQVLGTALDRRSDVFSAGIILAELLMGRPLFSGQSELGTLLAIRDARLDPFLEMAPALPSALADAVKGALTRAPEQRLPTAQHLREVLVSWQSESEAALRRELGELVAAAMGSDAEAPEATPLHELSWQASVAPAEHPPRSIEGSPARQVTGELPRLHYQIKRADGGLLGPWTYARTVQEVSVGTVGADDRVSVGGGAFRALSLVPELARHLPPARAEGPEGERADHEAAARGGSVPMDGGGFVGALGRTVLAQATGVWVCVQGGVRKEVYMSKGAPEFVTSNLAGEMLGEYLVSHGAISRGELDMALAVMPRFDGRLGDTLVALGLMEPVQLFRRIADQVGEKLLDLFLWRAGTATFHAGIEPPRSGFPLGIDPWRILDEGASRRIAAGLEAERWPAGGAFVLRDPLPSELAQADLPDAVARAVERLRSPVPVSPLAHSAHSPSAAFQRACVLLRHIGVVRVAEVSSP